MVNLKSNHMNKICFSFLALLFVTGCQQTPEVRETVLEELWKFSTGNDLQWALPDYDDSQWPSTSSSDWVQATELRRIRMVPHDLHPPEDMLESRGSLRRSMIRYDNADDSMPYFNGQIVGPPAVSGLWATTGKENTSSSWNI